MHPGRLPINQFLKKKDSGNILLLYIIMFIDIYNCTFEIEDINF